MRGKTTVIPAQPGWYVVGANDGWARENVIPEPIIGWLLKEITDRHGRPIVSCPEPIVVDPTTWQWDGIVQPDGRVIVQTVAEYESIEAWWEARLTVGAVSRESRTTADPPKDGTP